MSGAARLRSFGWLGASTVAGAAIGFGQSVAVVRALGVAEYGVFGVVAATAAICTNAVDLRLSDLATRLYYRPLPAEERSEWRGGLLLAVFAAQVLLALLLFGLVLAALPSVLRFFPSASVPAAAFVLFAAGEAAQYAGKILLFTLRFSERFGELAAVQLATVALRAGLVVAAVWWRPDVTGLAAGLAVAGICVTGLLAAVAAGCWRRVGLAPTRRSFGRAFRTIAASWRSLVAFNGLNYQNLLHRAADVLVVGLVAGERAAGLYKLARMATDKLYLVYDVAGKVLQPGLMRLLQEGRRRRFREVALQVTALSAASVTLLLLVEGAALDRLLGGVFGPEFVAARPAILWLTVPLFFVAGLQVWAWPWILHQGSIGAFAGAGVAAVVVGQYGIGVGGSLLDPAGGVGWFAAGYAAVYPILYGLLWRGLSPAVAAGQGADAVRPVAETA